MSKLAYVALDFPSFEKTKAFIESYKMHGIPVKVGMELFYAGGTQVINYLKENNHPIFLDLKLHDIPTTVQQAMKQLASFHVDIINVHAAGGKHMIAGAKEGLLQGGANTTKLYTVTQLTSTSNSMLRNELLIEREMEQVVAHYAKSSAAAGADGVVCAVQEVPLVKEINGIFFETITPGIRLQNDASDDQERIATPSLAKTKGTDYIVVGRAVTKASNPAEAYQQILKEWE
ncbi:orotidine-5'-phosphate decarboxylase [Halalkalibacillus halophilus]|uniref:orotidine-5'-phosphate decarboxylase n=1 Tax=Halalkalibacillus halophilus TaxID=392827 RepID=UPI000420F1F8|nr:orotidine-5'-phosphate decarboxylase [Halalkalibacillus halophilus]